MILEIISIVLILCTWFVLKTYGKRRNMPPGPLPLPLIGNLHQAGGFKAFTLEKLREKYGDIYTLSMPSGYVVFVNDVESAREALLTRKDIFEGRLLENMYPLSQICEGKDLVSADFNKHYLFRRSVFHLAMDIFGGNNQIKEQNVSHEVQQLIGQIENFDGKPFNPKRYIGLAIVTQMWKWISSEDCSLEDKTVSDLVKFKVTYFQLISTGAIYQVFPILKYLPTEFNNKVHNMVKERKALFDDLVRDHSKSYREGSVRDLTDAFISAVTKKQSKETNNNSGSIDDISYLLVNVILGASDSSTNFITWFILYMMLNQELQKKLQVEVDKTVGKDCIPGWEDVKNMPYLQATVCEIMRHSPFLLLSLPHNAREDTSIHGYHIPKATAVYFNYGNIHKDPKVWKQPQLFNPGRFIDGDGQFVGWKTLPGFMPFGIGRRICTGELLGKMQVLIFASALLQRFTFEVEERIPSPTLEAAESLGTLVPKDFNTIARKRL